MATIAVAVGVSAGFFSVAKALFFHSAGVPEVGRLVHYTIGDGPDPLPFSGPAYEALRVGAASQDFAIWNSSVELFLQTSDGAVKLSGALVNGDFFSVMNLKPAQGRFFDAHDDQSGGGSSGWSGVLGYSYWKTHFGKNPSIIGKLIVVDGSSVHIVGVLPEEFGGLNPPIAVEILLPQHFISVTSPKEDRFKEPGEMEWDVFGRLPQGSTPSSVTAMLHVIDAQVRKSADPTGGILTAENFPNLTGEHFLFAHTGELGGSYLLERLRMPLLAMESLTGILLFLCICNLVLLFVGRSKRQVHEAAVRIALGAGYTETARIAGLEALALAVCGSLLAIPLAWVIAHSLSLLVQSSDGLNSFPTAAPNITFLISGFIAATGAAVITAVSTALGQSDRRSVAALRATGTGVKGSSSSWIVGTEVFIAVFLIALGITGVVGAATLLHQTSGFAAHTVVTGSVGVIDADKKSAIEKMNRIIEQIKNAPGVQSVATMNVMPLSGDNARGGFAIRQKSGSFHVQQGMWPANVSLGYFSAAGTSVVRGRDFVSGDLAGDPVCLISMSAARALFGREDALGESIYSSPDGSGNTYCRVIGVARDAHFTSMSAPPDQAIYRLTGGLAPNIIVRAANSTLAAQAIRNAAHSIAPGTLTSSVAPIRVRMEDDLRIIRVLALFITLCSGITSLIMAIGIFGVLAIEVAACRRDIGVQIALGAGKLAVSQAVLKRFKSCIAAGFGGGSILALMLIVRLAGQYQVNLAIGVTTFIVGCLVLLSIILGAIIVPLRRALAISPMECLRSE